jgi:DNA-binding MarR family transcriptional regulator
MSEVGEKKKSQDFHLSMTSEQMDLQFPVLMLDLQSLYRKYFNWQMKATKLTSPQWQVLSCLARSEGITQTELAVMLNKGKSPVGKTLDSLEASGWVIREPGADDRRVKYIHLTDKLSTIDSELMNVVSEMNGVAEQGLNSESVEQLRNGLVQMRKNLQNATSEY